MDFEINTWSPLFINLKTNLILSLYLEKCIQFEKYSMEKKKTILAELALSAHNGLTRARYIRFFLFNSIPCWSKNQQPLNLQNWLFLLFSFKTYANKKYKKFEKLCLIGEIGIENHSSLGLRTEPLNTHVLLGSPRFSGRELN